MPTDGSVELIKANGNLSNNIALKASISKGDGTGRDGRYVLILAMLTRLAVQTPAILHHVSRVKTRAHSDIV